MGLVCPARWFAERVVAFGPTTSAVQNLLICVFWGWIVFEYMPAHSLFILLSFQGMVGMIWYASHIFEV